MVDYAYLVLAAINCAVSPFHSKHFKIIFERDAAWIILQVVVCAAACGS